MVKNILEKWKEDVVGLQETKTKNMSKNKRSLWRGPYVDWVTCEANGTKGSIPFL